MSSHGLDASRPADPTIDVELVDAVFDEWVARRAADPSVGYLVLYELASRRVGQPVTELDPALRRALGDRALPVIYPGSSFVPGSSPPPPSDASLPPMRPPAHSEVRETLSSAPSSVSPSTLT